MVSVPLRGLWFEITYHQKTINICSSGVSVPLRGLWFEIKELPQIAASADLVSVPLRGLWFEMSNKPATNGTGRKSFRPLAGFVV